MRNAIACELLKFIVGHAGKVGWRQARKCLIKCGKEREIFPKFPSIYYSNCVRFFRSFFFVLSSTLKFIWISFWGKSRENRISFWYKGKKRRWKTRHKTEYLLVISSAWNELKVFIETEYIHFELDTCQHVFNVSPGINFGMHFTPQMAQILAPANFGKGVRDCQKIHKFHLKTSKGYFNVIWRSSLIFSWANSAASISHMLLFGKCGARSWIEWSNILNSPFLHITIIDEIASDGELEEESKHRFFTIDR